MSIQNLLNEFFGPSGTAGSSGDSKPSSRSTLSNLTGNIPGGLAGGAAAGGIMALLMGNKSARKFAGKAATYGGAAILGGIAYKAFQNWQHNNADNNAGVGNDNIGIPDENRFLPDQTQQPAFELTLIKAMIVAARADGHIDDVEHQRIIKAIAEMDISAEMKGMVFDLLLQEISIEELVKDTDSIEQKSEIYLASCLAINPDHPAEEAHLDQLAAALGLPRGLASELQWQARKAINTLEG
ncbi:MAG: tellurite resistance TerB family protein [Gammaproteobacteria bacterium]|nr:tellurite resistance TerB family protein [Gammaproteobacteria bacterium]